MLIYSPATRRIAPRIVLAVVLSLLVVAMVSCTPDTSGLADGLYAVITTNKGEMIVQLEPDRAPLTTMNFVGLAEGSIQSNNDGKPFYDGLIFHRVEPGFVIQGGDPDGRGTGGPGYQFPTETHPDLLHSSEGVLAMANSGRDTNGSQFYITLSATPHLDGGYNVFGRVIRGMDVAREIEVGDTMKRVEILRVGDVAGAYQPTTEQFQSLVDQIQEKRNAATATLRRDSERLIESKWPGAELVDERGLLLVRTVTGSGSIPEPGDAVVIHFTWELLDGTRIDDTRARGAPFSFILGEGRLPRVMELAVGMIREGGSATAIIPPELAFGSAGIQGAVPPDSFVVFEIDVVSVE